MSSSQASIAKEASSNLLKRNSDDIRWEYGILVDENNLHRVKCKLCGKEVTGGIYRIKQHVGHIRGNVKACSKSNKEDQDKCKKSIDDVREKKRVKNTKEQEVRNEVVIDHNEGEGEGFEVIGSSSGPRAVGPMEKYSAPIDLSIPLSRANRQTSINQHIAKERLHMCNQYVARWLYAHGIPFNAINNYEFKQMLEAIGLFGPNYPGSSQYECRDKLLKEEVERTKNLLKPHEQERALSGCSIMTDAWTDKKRRSIMNIYVHCSLETSFLQLKEVSEESHTNEFIFEYVDTCIEKIGLCKLSPTMLQTTWACK